MCVHPPISQPDAFHQIKSEARRDPICWARFRMGGTKERKKSALFCAFLQLRFQKGGRKRCIGSMASPFWKQRHTHYLFSPFHQNRTSSSSNSDLSLIVLKPNSIPLNPGRVGLWPNRRRQHPCLWTSSSVARQHSGARLLPSQCLRGALAQCCCRHHSPASPS